MSCYYYDNSNYNAKYGMRLKLIVEYDEESEFFNDATAIVRSFDRPGIPVFHVQTANTALFYIMTSTWLLKKEISDFEFKHTDGLIFDFAFHLLNMVKPDGYRLNSMDFNVVIKALIPELVTDGLIDQEYMLPIITQAVYINTKVKPEQTKEDKEDDYNDTLQN